MPTILSNNLESRLTVAKMHLITREPFYGSLALHLDWQVSDDSVTAFTDGRRLVFGRKFCEKIPLAELLGIVCHEILHVALGHVWRRRHRPSLVAWNVACDMAVNRIVLGAGMTLPPDLVPPAETDASAEQLYMDDPDARVEWGAMSSSGEGDNEGEASAMAAVEAAIRAGNAPAEVARSVEARKPKADWRVILRTFVAAREHYSFRHRSRRSTGDIFLPGLRSERPAPPIIILDTSGSVSHSMLSAFSAEASEMVRLAGSGWLIAADAAVHSCRHLAADEWPATLTLVGGGGTDFRPAVKLAESISADNEAGACVYLTDGEGTFPESCDLPNGLIWCILTSGGTLPSVGSVIFLEE